jgi:hypothetical protein
MIKPRELESDKGRDIWDTITAAAAGDIPTLQRLLGRDPTLSRAEYWYTQPIHFAVREGHIEAVKLLLESGGDPEWNGYHDGSLIEMARDRGMNALPSFLRRRAIAGDELHRGRIIPSTWLQRPTISRASASFSTTIQAFWSAATVPALHRCTGPFLVRHAGSSSSCLTAAPTSTQFIASPGEGATGCGR